MDDNFNKFRKKFPVNDYKEVKEIPPGSGSLVTKLDLLPDQAFELLEVLYGPYKDLMEKFLFIDNKTTWERIYRTKNGILRIYDFKGSMSIGYSGDLTNNLKKDAEKLKKTIELKWIEYLDIKKIFIKKEIDENPLSNFTNTFGAVRLLIDKANKTGSLLEALVLYASFIDAQLRFGIILKNQLKNKTSNYDENLIFQRNESYISEGEIHSLALNEKFINDTDYKEISYLYKQRNRAVHRYFISDFEYADIAEILNRYEKIYKILSKGLLKLEKEQVKKDIGMTKKEHLELSEELKKQIPKLILLRIDSKQPYADVPSRKRMFPELE